MTREIASEYVFERVAGGDARWPVSLSSDIPNNIRTATEAICQELEEIVPRPASKEAISASPGKYVPALRHILELYDQKHLQAKKNQPSSELPRLFGLTPMVYCQWRFITVNAKTLGSITSMRVGTSHEEHLELFYKIFDFSRLGFKR